MSVVLQTVDLGTGPWPGIDPFLFIAHHLDHYPAGDDRLGPQAPLTGREIGMDFSGKDGWSMYHGSHVPGFPAHPHQGFETVTVVEEGFIDHTDSAGATARYGGGDTQWLTAGSGVSHCEMFPLLAQDRPNPLHLFQIWLNLAPEDKAAPADFAMFWAEQTPVVEQVDDRGRRARVKVVAGDFDGHKALDPPSASWAARAEAEVAIWHVELDAGATVTLPASAGAVGRVLYVYEGSATIDGRSGTNTAFVLDSEQRAEVTAGNGPLRALLLQGRPIGAPVVQHGPFVANTRDQLIAAYTDYEAGKFGRWDLPESDPVHGRDQGRFARYPDGRVVTPA